MTLTSDQETCIKDIIKTGGEKKGVFTWNDAYMYLWPKMTAEPLPKNSLLYEVWARKSQ